MFKLILKTCGSDGFGPFETAVRPQSWLWVAGVVGFGILAAVGVVCGCLTEVWLGGMAIYLVSWWVVRHVLFRDQLNDARANSLQFLMLQRCPPGKVAAHSRRSDAGSCLQSAGALLTAVHAGGEGDVDAVVEAVLSRYEMRIEQLFLAGANATRIGMAGTCTGLLLLLATLDQGDGVAEFADSMFAAVGGMALSMSTTLAGLVIDCLLSTQASLADMELSRTGKQIRGQLSFLRYERRNDEKNNQPKTGNSVDDIQRHGDAGNRHPGTTTAPTNGSCRRSRVSD